jgi:hypothetical protein
LALGPSPFALSPPFSPTLGHRHTWVYRGQVLPTDKRVTVQAAVTHVDNALRSLRADGFLTVDGRVIYQMTDFALTIPASRK